MDTKAEDLSYESDIKPYYSRLVDKNKDVHVRYALLREKKKSLKRQYN